MARFDKKWLFIHIPAGLVVAALLGFGVVQCDGKNEESAEKVKAQNQLVDAGKKIEIAANRMDSLLNVNRNLGADNVRKSDTIRVLKDSVNVLNGRVRELRADNDSLIIALDDCAKSKVKSKEKPKTKAKKPAVVKKNKPALVNKPKKAPVKRDTVYVVVKPKTENRNCCAGTEARYANVTLDASYNNGNVLVDNAPTNANVRLDNGAVNNGNVVVGNANTVYQVMPDTIVRFSTTKNTVLKCRVIAKQRQYR